MSCPTTPLFNVGPCDVSYFNLRVMSSCGESFHRLFPRAVASLFRGKGIGILQLPPLTTVSFNWLVERLSFSLANAASDYILRIKLSCT